MSSCMNVFLGFICSSVYVPVNSTLVVNPPSNLTATLTFTGSASCGQKLDVASLVSLIDLRSPNVLGSIVLPVTSFDASLRFDNMG